MWFFSLGFAIRVVGETDEGGSEWVSLDMNYEEKEMV